MEDRQPQFWDSLAAWLGELWVLKLGLIMGVEGGGGGGGGVGGLLPDDLPPQHGGQAAPVLGLAGGMAG